MTLAVQLCCPFACGYSHHPPNGPGYEIHASASDCRQEHPRSYQGDVPAVQSEVVGIALSLHAEVRGQRAENANRWQRRVHPSGELHSQDVIV